MRRQGKTVLRIHGLLLLLLAVLLCLWKQLPGSGLPEGDVLYQQEAEKGTLSQGAYVQRLWSSPKIRYVANLGTEGNSVRQDGSVTFDDVNMEYSGNYLLHIYFLADETDRYFDLTVNGETAYVACATTNTAQNWKKVLVTAVPIQLQKGNNSITFHCKDWYAPYLDKIVITADDTEQIASDFLRLEAEDAALQGGASIVENDGFSSGMRQVTGLGKGAAVFSDITVSEAGSYALQIDYVTSAARVLDVTVDAQATQRVTCLPASTLPGAPSSAFLVLTLDAGQHTLRFGSTDGVAPNLDCITLFPCEVLEGGKDAPTLLYDTDRGLFHVLQNGRVLAKNAYAAYRDGDVTIRTDQYARHQVAVKPITDAFGRGKLLTVTHSDDAHPTIEQNFHLYESQQYLLSDIRLLSTDQQEVATNWISPFNSSNAGYFSGSAESQALQVPYDNDDFVTFEAPRLNGLGISHEVTALFSESTGESLILGSVSHDTWKTGINHQAWGGQLRQVSVYGGVSNKFTQDQSPHGMVHGKEINSPTVLIGYYKDWQDGMNDYALANTHVVPRKQGITNQVPIGWNSWGSIQDSLTKQDAFETSDYIKEHFQDTWKTDENIVYVNLDSFWDFALQSDAALQEFVEHCKANGQKAGIYWGPFVCWLSEADLDNHTLEGSDVSYRDAILRTQDGQLYQPIDGAYPLDSSHPAVYKRIDHFMNRFLEAGFEYIKLDFLTHGSLEGQHYDPEIQTGLQAYNKAMQYLLDKVGHQMFINLSIAPIFPYQYADGRRIACDTFYSISDTKYMLNGLTFGFWEKQLYAYPDPDHIVVWGKDGRASLEEARSRVTSGIIAGTSFLTGDNFQNPAGNQDKARQRYLDTLTNPDIIRVAQNGNIFQPLAISHGFQTAANAYVMRDGDDLYLAVFNFSRLSKNFSFTKAQLQLSDSTYQATELWSGSTQSLTTGTLQTRIAGKDAKVFRLHPTS